MYEFWFDYVKQKYGEKVKISHMDTDSYIVYIKTGCIYSDIAKDEATFDTSNYELHRPLSKGKNKKVIGVVNDELGGKIMTEFSTLRPKTYSYLTDNNDENKEAEDTKMCVMERKLKSEDYKHCFEATQLENEINRI